MGTKISALGAATTLDGTEVFALVQGGITKKATLSLAATQNALGSAGAPSIAFTGGAGFTDKGLYSDGSNTVALAIGGARKFQFYTSGLQLLGGANAINSGTANTGLILDGNISVTTGDSVQLRNNGVVFTGGAGIAQSSVTILAGINQTSTAGFTALALKMGLVAAGTGTPVFGSAGGLFFDCQSNSVSLASIRSDGFGTFSGLAPRLSTQDLGFSAGSWRSAYINTSILGVQTTAATPSLVLGGVSVLSGSATAQVGLNLQYGVNQTSTAGFTALQVDLGVAVGGAGGAPVFGSTGGKFFDFRSNSASIASMDSAGRLSVGAGSVGLPSVAVGEATTGLWLNGTGALDVALGGSSRWRFISSALIAVQNGLIINTNVSNGYLTLGGAYSTAALAPIRVNNAGVFIASTAVEQNAINIIAGINQTSTASFAAISTDLGLVAAGTGVPVFGSGGGAHAIFRANSVVVGKITAAGSFLGTGTTPLPALAFIAAPDLGFNPSGTTAIEISFAGSSRTGFAYTSSTAIMYATTTGAGVGIYGLTTSGTQPAVSLKNGSTGSTNLSGSSGAQVGTLSLYGVNQTGSAGFENLKLATTETAVGTGAQYLLTGYAGAGGTTLQFSVSNAGGTASTAISPGALAITVNDSTALGQSGFARLTGNASNTAITGFLATNVPDGRMVVLVNIGAPTITLNHQNAGSAAANRIITATGANVVLSQDDSIVLVYDLTTQRWRQITTLA